MSILQWGWNSYFEAVWNDRQSGSSVPARVITAKRGMWRVTGDFGECPAEAAGKLRLAADEGGGWPAVGDWVTVELRDNGSAALILEVLPRRSQFVRKVAGRKVAEQVIAANVDTALLVSALDGDFNPRRVERYLAQCWESRAKPTIVLNKADVCEKPGELAQKMEAIAIGTPVIMISAKTGQGFDQLETYLKPGQTLVLLGSSGVGKSTILNRLMGPAIQEVQPVRESDSRGKHTTTTRELFVLPGGALLMDTPGLRELQLWDAGEGISQTFSDIESLAARCKFGNCRHEAEPGCAVALAIQNGELPKERLENYRKLLREQRFLLRKIDAGAQHEAKRQIKSVNRAVRRLYRERESNGKR